MCHMYMTDFAYDGPIFLVPLSLSYPSSTVVIYGTNQLKSNILNAVLGMNTHFILIGDRGFRCVVIIKSTRNMAEMSALT